MLSRLRSIVLVFSFLLALAVGALGSPVASAEANGVVTGVVINQTTGQPVPGIEVTLSRFERQAPQSVDISTTSDADGRFAFNDLDTATGFVYAAAVRYDRVLYSTSMIVISSEAQQDVAIDVYDTTRDDTAIHVQARGLIVSNIDSDDGVITLSDVLVLENSANVTYIGDEEGRTLRVTVPRDTLVVTPRPGFDFSGATVEDDTIYASAPLRPGVSNATLEYQIPYTDTTADVTLRADYATDILRVLVPVSLAQDIAIGAIGTTFVDQGTVTIENRDYRVWLATSQERGAILSLRMENLPRTSIEPMTLRTTEPALIALSMLVIATAATGYIVVRRKLHLPRPVALSPDAMEPLDHRREELTLQLRAVEEDWREGRIDESTYRETRRQTLEQLRAIFRQYRGIGEDEM